MKAPAPWMAGGAVALLLVTLWVYDRDDEDARPPPSVLGSTQAPFTAIRTADSAPQASTPAAAWRDPAAFGLWMRKQSSLRGTELDGAWDIDSEGRLRPSLALRRRFDHLLTLSGEAEIPEITAYIAHEVRTVADSSTAAQLLDLWQRYLTLQQYTFRTQPDPQDPRSWAAVLAERQQARRQILGPEVAFKFFNEEDARLQDLMQRRSASMPAGANPGNFDRAALDGAAIERLQREDARWADWERRLDQARTTIAALQAAPELSDLQRRSAIKQLIAQRFEPNEAPRVRALLKLPVD